jgi:hypothetical protein
LQTQKKQNRLLRFSQNKKTNLFFGRAVLWCLIFSGCFFLISSSACRKNDNASSSNPIDVFGISDETDDAAKIVQDANEDLKKIKKLYKENQSQVEELKNAMSGRDTERVKKIADDLVYLINDGFVLGESAITKIEKAAEMKTNEKYKEYLQLKGGSLRKELDAFEFRRQAALLIRDGFGTKDKTKIENAKTQFREKEENFQKYMEVARQMSQEANQIAKEALSNSK